MNDLLCGMRSEVREELEVLLLANAISAHDLVPALADEGHDYISVADVQDHRARLVDGLCVSGGF